MNEYVFSAEATRMEVVRADASSAACATPSDPDAPAGLRLRAMRESETEPEARSVPYGELCRMYST